MGCFSAELGLLQNSPVTKSPLMFLARSVRRLSLLVSEEDSQCTPGILLMSWCASQLESSPSWVVQPT